jgi:RimJ/RimL family protein N-acetyltransferase
MLALLKACQRNGRYPLKIWHRRPVFWCLGRQRAKNTRPNFSMVFMKKIEAITFKKMTAEHLSLWNAWIEIPHVKNVWFIEGYEPAGYMANKLAGNGYDFPFIIYLNERPIGFIQTCDLYAYRTLCEKPKGVFCHEEPGTFGLDLFIADENLLGKGLGTKIVQAFIQKLIDEFKAKKILIDPAADNLRAIRCYEKAGFKKLRTAHDGVCEVIVMEWLPGQTAHIREKDGDAQGQL